MVVPSTDITLAAVDYDPFAGPEIARLAPTTAPQQEVWMACVLGGNDANRAYNESVALRLRGQLDRAAMEQAVQELVRQHEALRSAFSADGLQICIFRDVATPFSYLDLTGLAGAEQEKQVQQYVRQDALYVFDLMQGPLFKIGLIRLSDQEHHLVLTAHHIVCDGWSMGIMMQDLSKLYSAFVRNMFADLPTPNRLSLFAEEQAVFVQGSDYKVIEDFWVDQFRSDVPVMDLPTDFPRPKPRTFKSSRQDYALDNQLVQAIKNVGAKAGASFVTTLMTAFEVLLQRLTGQADVMLGLPAAGQSATGYYRLIGHCVNLLPLRSRPDVDQSFVEFLRQRKSEFFDALEHQQLTFGSLLKRIAVVRDTSRVPLVPVVFNIDMGLADGVDFYGLTYQLINNPREYENFEIFLNATGTEDALILEWSYNTQLFRPATIDRMMADFEQLLRAIVAEPGRKIRELGRAEAVATRSNPYEQLNHTKRAYPDQKTLHQLITEQVERTPNKVALRFGTAQLTYQELNARANQLAQYLLTRNVKPGDIIGLSVERTESMVIALLAIMKCGAAYVPLDPAYPKDRLAFMMSDTAARFLITSKNNPSVDFETPAERINLEDALIASAAYAGHAPSVSVTSSQQLYVLYTSGSTGKPKGVQITHRNMINFLWSMREVPGLTPDDRVLALTTISFDIAGLELFLPLITGATIVLADAATARDGYRLLKLAEQERVTLIQATPSTWRMMLYAGWTQKLPIKALCGGEALQEDLAETLLKQSDSLWNVYGPTEITVWGSVKQVLPTDSLITVGRPIANTQFYVLDEQQRLVEAGTVGELYIGGDGVALGYLNRPELNAERFLKDPFSDEPGARMYRTGDLGKLLENGDIQCLGRTDHQVKIRGHRIELGEIENAITSFDDVREAVVVPREDQPGHQRLVAYIVPATESRERQGGDWKERWDMLYDMGVQEEKQLNLTEQNLDVAISKQLSNHRDISIQVDEWIGQSIARIRGLNPRRIREVGCGAGQLLLVLAPDVEQYVATDYAQTAIDKLNEKIVAQPDQFRHVMVQAGMADDFTMLGSSKVDLVLIHSVAQYFPDADYLLTVVRNAAQATAPGGCILIGDMQGKNTLEMHHAYDQLQRSSDERTLAEFKQIVARRVQMEDEFLADPAFFYKLPQLIPAIAGVDIQLRKGTYWNETTKYHYDVWLYVGKAPEAVRADLEIDGNDVSLATIEQQLRANPQSVIRVRNLFNDRTAADFALHQLVSQSDNQTPVGIIKQQVSQARRGFDPDLFWKLAESAGHRAFVRWQSDGMDNLFEVVFMPDTFADRMPGPPFGIAPAEQLTGGLTPLKLTSATVRESIQSWKHRLADSLPEYMIPAEFVVLPYFPLTPNGKVDRKALPKPDTGSQPAAPRNVKKRSREEDIVAAIWADVLRLETINSTDNFFELGGHSLLAVQVMTRIEKETGKRLPLAALFEHPSVEELAQMLREDSKPVSWDALVPIKPKGSKMPLYIVHGAGLHVLLFNTLAMNMHPDQPVYGLQAKGINGIDKPLGSIEEIAAYYIEAILASNPDGPYALAGYSFGGIIAFEMHRQLQAMGKEVKLLAMFDTYAQQSLASASLPKRAYEATRLFIRKFLYTFVLLKDDPQVTIGYKKETMKRRIQELYWKLRYGEDEHKAFKDISYVINKSNKRAWNNYQLTPQNVTIELFRAKKRTYYLDDFEFLGWKPLALNGVNIHEVPGDHNYLFAAPNDKEFARILQKVLDEC